ncbi:MAG TPA: hypothetical protein PLF73_10915, partial [Luteimonas sp.]|nr:hypothetical protein [Luteimonas sp.]
MNHDHNPALDPRVDVAGLLALELSPGSGIARDALAPDEAARLATLLGRDLAARVPAAAALELCLAAAHFDPAEALRPGWPLHRRLKELQARAPGRDAGARIIAFGAHPDDPEFQIGG